MAAGGAWEICKIEKSFFRVPKIGNDKNGQFFCDMPLWCHQSNLQREVDQYWRPAQRSNIYLDIKTANLGGIPLWIGVLNSIRTARNDRDTNTAWNIRCKLLPGISNIYLKRRNDMSVFSGVLFVIDEHVVKSLSVSLPDWQLAGPKLPANDITSYRIRGHDHLKCLYEFV